MKIIGNAHRRTPWAGLARAQRPGRPGATIPGCQRLEALGEDAYAMTVAAGVGSIKGVYDGQVPALRPRAAPVVPCTRGSGAAGTVDAAVAVRFTVGRRRHLGHLRRRRRGRRHDRRRRAADAGRRLQADGRGVLRQRRDGILGSAHRCGRCSGARPRRRSRAAASGAPAAQPGVFTAAGPGVAQGAVRPTEDVPSTRHRRLGVGQGARSAWSPGPCSADAGE